MAADDLPTDAKRLLSTLVSLRDRAENVGNHKQQREYDEQIQAIREKYDEEA